MIHEPLHFYLDEHRSTVDLCNGFRPQLSHNCIIFSQISSSFADNFGSEDRTYKET